jgi:hypothetical protein
MKNYLVVIVLADKCKKNDIYYNFLIGRQSRIF